MRQPPRCPKCLAFLELPAEHPDGLPGIKYRVCNGCGYVSAVTRRKLRERLDK